ncbi:hypothetical protein RFI_00772 [Reticulomyxa filosa]|uniref:Uncharacterized protein n=1 Tax=Reticulomyxa filosa TaxID=46433 RepID=X6PF33_RETFI|nr:hypothetical protein RFI_00772 [Reticulomyxa filosa]|eukprot:ETO36287.1 hypothetical protein RFI_00772 [Reticulomyxa filosa]
MFTQYGIYRTKILTLSNFSLFKTIAFLLVNQFFLNIQTKKGFFSAVNFIMLAQPQHTFPETSEEIISDVLKWFDRDAEKDILTWLTENTTNLKQQYYLMRLFKIFGDKLGKTIISQTWKNCNQIYVDTRQKLKEICATSNLNELNAIKLKENELKILRGMCLHILWNILKYPKHIKYRQIHKQALCNYLFQKCCTLGADFEKVLISMEKELQYIGFKKRNDDNWYYQYDNIQSLHLWDYYQEVIINQAMYALFCCFNKTNINDNKSF